MLMMRDFLGKGGRRVGWELDLMFMIGRSDYGSV